MGRKKLVDIWFVFRVWEIEENYGDFICVTWILCLGKLENFKLQLGFKLGCVSYVPPAVTFIISAFCAQN